jgi:hypothetical protein
MAAGIQIDVELAAPPWAPRALLAALLILAAAGDLCGLEQVQMTVFFPAPSGAYGQLLVNQSAFLAANSASGGGAIAEIGSIVPPQDSSIRLMLNNSNQGNMSIGSNNPYASGSGTFGQGPAAPNGIGGTSYGGLYIGPGPGGAGGIQQPQIQLDDSSGGSGQISRWQNQLEIWSTDKVTFATAGDPFIAYIDNEGPGSTPELFLLSNTAADWYGPTTAPYILGDSTSTLGGDTPHTCSWVPGQQVTGWGSAAATCPSGTVIMGGGGTCLGADLEGSYPYGANTWAIQCGNSVLPGFPLWNTAYAYCCYL